MGAWSAPLHPVKPHLFADQVRFPAKVGQDTLCFSTTKFSTSCCPLQVPETFQYGAFRQQRMPGLPLKNYHGKTCFVNAVVQVLVHNPYVREQGKEHFGQYCQCKSCLMCYLGYCVHSAYGKTAQTELALPAWLLQHGFPMLAAGKKHQQPLSPERQVMILFVCQICVNSQALGKLKCFKHSFYHVLHTLICIFADTGGRP